jgi:polyhydroxyalkanoate synthesis regulator protein
MFQNAMRMFTPFPAQPEQNDAAAETEKPAKSDDLQDLKAQIAAMQRRLDEMGND